MGTKGEDCGLAPILISLVAAGVASEVEAERVRRHIADCEACRRRLEEATSLVEAVVNDAAEVGCLAPGAAAGAARRIAESLGPRLTATGRSGDRRWLESWLGLRPGLRTVLEVTPAMAVFLAALGPTLARLARGEPAHWAWTAVGVELVAALVVVPFMLISRRTEEEEEE